MILTQEKFKKIKIFLVILSLLANYFLLIPKTYAQSSGGGSAGGGFNIQGVGAVAVSCVDLPGLIMSGIGELGQMLGFGGGGGNSSSGSGNEVPVGDSKVRKETEKTKEEVQSSNKKEQCLDALARYAVLKIIDKITYMTVEWINSGFQGNPFYPENQPNFFEQIAKEEIYSFTSWFGADASLYPFGETIIRTILSSARNKLQQNLVFSLNQFLAHGQYPQFMVDFSVGGWAGYLAFAQPNNNVFGNYLMINQNLSSRVQGTNITKNINFSRQLERGMGVLDQQICVLTATGNPNDQYIGPNNSLHIPPGEALPQSVVDHVAGVINVDPSQYDVINNNVYTNMLRQRSICNEWKTTTPGRFIAEQTSHALGSPLRNLELADELNENLGLIFDALLYQLVNQGLNSLQGTSGNVLYSQVQDPNTGSNFSTINTPITELFSGNGIDPGIVQVQLNYISQAQSNILQIVDDVIIPIRVLDYCVPGPNPRWYEDGLSQFEQQIYSVPNANFQDITQTQIYYANLIQDMVGVTISPTPLIQSQVQFVNFMLFVLEKYKDYMYSVYSPSSAPPSVRPSASSIYSQLPYYLSEINLYQNQVNTLTGLLPQLTDLQNQINALPEPNNPSHPATQAVLSIFSQLANQGLVNQSQLNQLQSRPSVYATFSNYINTKINECVAEVGIGVNYTGPNTRVVYPYADIQAHPAFTQIPPPNSSTFFVPSVGFGGSPGTINISGFETGVNISIGTNDTTVFESMFNTIY